MQLSRCEQKVGRFLLQAGSVELVFLHIQGYHNLSSRPHHTESHHQTCSQNKYLFQLIFADGAYGDKTPQKAHHTRHLGNATLHLYAAEGPESIEKSAFRNYSVSCGRVAWQGGFECLG